MVGGLWHGASWMFIIWGALHGTAIVLHRAWQQMGLKMNSILAWFITFNFINITWIFFRAKEWEDAKNILSSMSGINGILLPEKYAKYFGDFNNTLIQFGTVFSHMDGKKAIIYIFIAVILILSTKNTSETIFHPSYTLSRIKAFYYGMLTAIAIVIMSTEHYSEFIYFNF